MASSTIAQLCSVGGYKRTADNLASVAQIGEQTEAYLRNLLAFGQQFFYGTLL